MTTTAAWDEPMTLADAKAAVLAARHDMTQVDAQYQAALQDFQEHYADLLMLRAHVKEWLGEAETALREMALAHFTTTQDKHPIAGVTIKEVTRLYYDPETALDWALGHLCCLVLDVKAFEAVAKAIVLPFVVVRKEPQAQVAKDLEEE